VQGLNWRVRETAHFVFHYLPDSYAADHLPWITGRAERAWRELRAFVGEGMPPPAKIKVYLMLLVPHPEQAGVQLTRGSYADPQTGEIWAVCRPESPAEGLEESIGHLLVFQPYAPVAGQVPFLREGLVAYVLAHVGRAPNPEKLHQAPVEMMRRGEFFLIFPWLVEQSIVDQREHSGIALSFFSYLGDQYGIAALQTFLGQYSIENPDQAGMAAYQKPLGALNEEWMGTLGSFVSAKVSLGDFFHRLTPYLKPYPFQLVEIMVYLLFAVGFGLALQGSQKFLIDNVIGPPPPDNAMLLLGQLLAALGIAFVINAVASLRRSYLTAWVSEKILLRLRYDMFQHLMDLSASFYSKARIGDIVSRMSNDLVVVQMALTQVALSGVYYILSFVLATIALFLLDWHLSLVVVVTLPLLFVATKVLSSRVTTASRERSERLADNTDVLQERLNAQSVVRAFSLMPLMMQQFQGSLDRLFGSSVRLVLLGSLYTLSSSLITSLIQLIILGLGAYLILTGSFSVGSLFAFLGLLGSVTSPVEQATQLLQQLQQAAGSMQRVVQILDERVEVEDAPDAQSLPRMQQEIRFENVWFSYTGDRPTLQDLTIDVKAGSHVAVVGPSGSGKSTVINLALRFYDPQQGRVTIDGHDLREVTQDSLRQQISVVFQDTFVFNTSIRENLQYGRLDATEAEIIEAAKAAEIHDYVSEMPSGYETTVGERGSRLSGGQRQRLAIARALLRRPTILLLDEATSALDPETESQINATINKVTKERGLTTIFVTHRLASAANADYIYVLDRGMLVEQGAHDQLIAANGLYARLYEEQYGANQAGVPQDVQTNRLRRVPLFTDLPPEILAAVASRLQMERFAEGDTIIHQGDIGDKFYMIDRGQVEITIGKSQVEERQLNTLHEGDYFGEIALLRDSPRTASVRALGSVQALSLSKTDFRLIVERAPGVAERLLPMIETRLAQQQEQLGAPS